MKLHNTTHLDTQRLAAMMNAAVADWPHDDVHVAVRYSRGAEFSGSCSYRTGRLHVNLGRRNRYPYRLAIYVARPQTDGRFWWREPLYLETADAYQLALFIFLHEFYHWLVRRARRNTRQKEARCDRFAARALVDRYGAVVRDRNGRPVRRELWDIQDLDRFVARARRRSRSGRPGETRTVAVADPCPRAVEPVATRVSNRVGAGRAAN